MTMNPTFLFYLATGIQIGIGLGWIWLIIYFIRREKKYMAIVVRSMIPRPPTSSPMKRLMAALNGEEKEEELDPQEAIEEAERIIAESRDK